MLLPFLHIGVKVKTKDIEIAILRIEGTNCEQESYDAFKRLGASPEFVHLKQLLHIDCNKDEKRDVFDYQCLMVPGGFSAGDYIRGGAIFAARMKSKLDKDLIEFVKQEYPILGVCNGFQVLTELGLLPGIKDIATKLPDAVLNINDSNRFECRPTLLKHENKGKCVFTSKIPKNDVRLIPSAHAEGKLLFPLDKQEEYLKELEKNDQIVFRYVDPDGNYAGYPWNPNGSISNIAGICNNIGNVFGVMPHPERTFYRHQHSDWPEAGIKNDIGDGKAIFESVLDYITKKF
ncbi:MAG: phosphoribosylformylglycinamidine synthase subunit PurQ [Thermoplasmatales archaeon]|nr:phosphoribosylformylglycinamidine synthase subunit PurQ [Thermoplasmatales archaeon]